METPRVFEVLIRRKISYIGGFLSALLLISFSVLFLLFIIMLLGRLAPGAMATVYYFWVVPDWLKTVSAYSGLGFLIVAPLYYRARLLRPAVLTFHADHLSITGQQTNVKIPFRKINRVFCNDLHRLFHRPERMIRFVIGQKGRRNISFRLKHYEEAGEVLSAITSVAHTGRAFYEEEVVGGHRFG